MSPATYINENYQPKVYFSEYLRSDNKPAEDEKSADTLQPDSTEAE